MIKQKYQVTLINGKKINDLTHEEATKYFYEYAGCVVRPWPVQEYKAP